MVVLNDEEKEIEKKKRLEVMKSLVLKILKDIRDPETGMNLVDSGLIRADFVSIDENEKNIDISWIPTTPFCPLILHISAVIRYILVKHFKDWKVKVKLHPDVIGSDMWNEKLKNESLLESILNEIKERGWMQYFYSGDIE